MDTTRAVEMTDDQWRERLSPEQYEILRGHGTERPFTGEYLNVKDDGTFTCAGCGAELFSSDTKFDSGTGWPSFYEPAVAENVETREDRSLGMAAPRSCADAAEVTSATCSTTARTPPACGTASTRARWASTLSSSTACARLRLDVLNDPLEPSGRRRGTFATWEVTNVPRCSVAASSGTLCMSRPGAMGPPPTHDRPPLSPVSVRPAPPARRGARGI